MNSNQKEIGRLAKAMDRKPGENRKVWKNRRSHMKEKFFSSHRELPNGRNFMCFNHEHDPEADQKYRDNFDSIFPNAPGAGL